MSIPGALAFVVCLGGLTAMAWLVSQPGIPPVDTAATSFLHGLASPTLDALMTALTGLGSSVVLAAIAGLAAVLLVARRRRAEAVFVALALVGALLLSDAIKLVVHRPRPGFDWAEVWPEYSFPSGHAMHSFVVLCRDRRGHLAPPGTPRGASALAARDRPGRQHRHQPHLPGSALADRRPRGLPGRGAVAPAPGLCLGLAPPGCAAAGTEQQPGMSRRYPMPPDRVDDAGGSGATTVRTLGRISKTTGVEPRSTASARTGSGRRLVMRTWQARLVSSATRSRR